MGSPFYTIPRYAFPSALSESAHFRHPSRPWMAIPPGPKHSIILIQNKSLLPRQREIPAPPAGHDVIKEQMCHQRWLKHSVSFIRLVVIGFVAFPLSLVMWLICVLCCMGECAYAFFVQNASVRSCIPHVVLLLYWGNVGERRAWQGARRGHLTFTNGGCGGTLDRKCWEHWILSLSSTSKHRPTQEGLSHGNGFLLLPEAAAEVINYNSVLWICLLETASNSGSKDVEEQCAGSGHKTSLLRSVSRKPALSALMFPLSAPSLALRQSAGNIMSHWL